MTTSTNCRIPYVPEGTLDPAAGLNEAIRVIDALLQTQVIDVGVDSPPGSPDDGDMYIVGNGSGAWLDQDDNLARYVADGAFWEFFEAGAQVRIVLNLSDGSLWRYSTIASPVGWAKA